ncbi:ATP-binding protein [Pseudoalteromonas sp. CNC9-20]|uniref:HAMP domain-containing hybrid sensor histidine kinase/response regulator n=1 Tax=Pseudoalteromonas sp. CNC9-20 TaxID=2917750 RepID=UPI001EF40947|nr:ATP-binding protein [Pseudoalteromonas sp. CNC9-20]MCG7570211.1 ATP-binding protein [Pseudoalteromonas sp. CNC9-20]
MKTSKLSIRLLWYITPVVILPLLFLGGFTLTNVTSSSQQQTQLIVSRFVEQQQNKVFHSLNVYHSTTELLTSSPVLQDFVPEIHQSSDRYTERLAALMDVFGSYTQAYPDILSINLVSPQQKSYAYFSTKLESAPQAYPFFEKLSASSLRRQQFMVQNERGETTLYFVQKVFTPDYHLERPILLGYVIMRVQPTVLNTAILESPYNNTLNLMLTEQGKILFSSNHALRGQSIASEEMRKISLWADNGRLNELALHSIDHTQRLVYAVQMAGGHYFITSIPKELLYESGKVISLITALIVMISVITLPILIFIVVRNLLLNPIEQLGAASHRVGENDLAVRLPDDRKDEVGQLFSDFNHMVNKIYHTQGELEEYKNTLEQKVEARTLELEKTNKALELAIEQAEQANQLKSRFLANMSHEIRTPLTAIMGFTEQLLDNNKIKEEKVHTQLATVLRNSRHLLELINNILDLSKIEAEKLDMNHEPVSLYELLHDLESIVEPQAQQKQLQFDIDYHFPLPKYLSSDQTRLKQILLNILTNAVKFTTQGGVHMSIRYQSGMLEFVVTDTGIGISDKELDRIFKPFEQADATTTRRFGGSGLGLCIAKNLAQLLGGDIWAQSQQGVGSQFTIHVACYQQYTEQDYYYDHAQMQPVYSERPALSEQRFDGDILVAEDNKDNQALISLLLERWGIEPDFANNGAEAVEKALVKDYQLILMDMQMPVMGGEEATKMLRHAAYDGPIIALTANVMKHDIERYLGAGCDKTLGKPIDKQELEHTLATYLSIQQEAASQWDDILQSERFLQINANYKEKLPEYLDEVLGHHHDGDWEQLQSLAHSIKGSASCFGFFAIAEAAGELEQVLRQGHHDSHDYSVLKLEHAIRYVLEQDVEPS